MSEWTSIVSIRSTKPLPEMSAIAKWDGVEKMWSTTGDWDWCIKLDQKSSSPEKTEEFVSRLRNGHWATETRTNWWKEVAAK